MEWPDDIIYMVWNKGAAVDGFEPVLWRKDECGAWIARLRYGDRSSLYGWEISRILPDGPDAVPNLRPLQWRNCVETGDGILKCRVGSAGDHNVLAETLRREAVKHAAVGAAAARGGKGGQC